MKPGTAVCKTARNTLGMLSIAALTLAGVGCTTKASAPVAKKGGDGVPVTVATVVRKDVPLDIQIIGNVEAYATITIKAQVTGQLTRVSFQEGDFVKKGDLLFTIDPRPYEAQLSQAEANLARSEAAVGQAQANLKRDSAQERYSKSQAARSQSLFQEGIVSKDQVEQITASSDAISEAVNADRAAVKSAEADITANRAAVENSKVMLSYTTIRSTIDGRAGYLMVKEGNLVTANTVDLITINQVEPIFVTFSVPEDQLLSIKEYMSRGKLLVFAIPQDEASVRERGELTLLDNTVDPTTGTIKLKATFANSDHKLWPGQFVRVILRLTTQPDVTVVPSQAVQTGQEGPFVYVVKADRTVESRPVVTGSQFEQDTVIQKGLEPGTTIVTEGQLRLAPGMRVQMRRSGEGGGRGRGGAGGQNAPGAGGQGGPGAPNAPDGQGSPASPAAPGAQPSPGGATPTKGA